MPTRRTVLGLMGVGAVALSVPAREARAAFVDGGPSHAAPWGWLAPLSQGSNIGGGWSIASLGKGHLAVVSRLLAAGANASATDSSGFAPLHDAAASGNTALADVLLAAGADKSLKVKEGWKKIEAGMTAADIARVCGHTELAEHLA